MNISFNAAVIASESGFSKHFGAAITILAFVWFLCKLRFQYILRSFLFVSVTSRLNSFSDVLWCIPWYNFIHWFISFSKYWIYIIKMIQTKLLIKNWASCLWQKRSSLLLALSIGTKTKLLSNIFNFSVIVSSSSFNVFLLFSIVTLVDRWLIFSSYCWYHSLFPFRK